MARHPAMRRPVIRWKMSGAPDYAHIFNPARLMPKAMQTHMPKKYWHDLPESRLIRPLIATARARSEAMIAAPATQARRSLSACATHSRETSALRAEEPLTTLSDLPHALSACRRCALHCHATQPVAGHGPDRAPLMIVGEQPGDQEDIAGKPFVGPAGRVLDIALERTGIDRRSCYVTNAVKHFKFETRGKHRLHKSPDAAEIEHCRWWLQQERALRAAGADRGARRDRHPRGFWQGIDRQQCSLSDSSTRRRHRRPRHRAPVLFATLEHRGREASAVARLPRRPRNSEVVAGWARRRRRSGGSSFRSLFNALRTHVLACRCRPRRPASSSHRGGRARPAPG